MDALTALPVPAGSDAILAATNGQLAVAGLSITREDALMLAERRAESLAEVERVEFGTPAAVAIAEAVATSTVLDRGNVADTLAELQDAFYTLRDELPVDVPDAEIVEALRNSLDEKGDAGEVSVMPANEVMAHSREFAQAAEAEEGEGYRIVDEEGNEYTFDPANWNYDEQSSGWDGEGWSDDWDD